MDAVKGRCARDPCRYFHPPLHLQAQIKAAQNRATAVWPLYMHPVLPTKTIRFFSIILFRCKQTRTTRKHFIRNSPHMFLILLREFHVHMYSRIEP